MNRATPTAHVLGRLAPMVAWCWLVLAASFSAGADDYYDQFVDLVEEQAQGARQVGQAGNDQVSRRVGEIFATAVAKANVDKRQQQQQAEVLLGEARLATANVLEARQNLEQIAQGGAAKDSPWYKRYTLERPTLLVLVLLAHVVMIGIAWRLQPRPALVVVGVICLVGAMAFPFVAAAVKTEAERIAEQAKTGVLRNEAQVTMEVLEQQVNAAMVAALKADRVAAEQLRGLWQSGTIKSPAAVFTSGNATMTVAGQQVPLYQMAPNLVEPANLPVGGVEKQLVYAGTALPHELDPVDHRLSESAVLLDFDCFGRWLSPVRRGASMVIFIEPPQDAITVLAQAGQKISQAPLSIPRFYIKRRHLVKAFGDDWHAKLKTQGQTVRIEQPAPGRWDRRLLDTHWLFIPGSSEPAVQGTDFAKDPARQVVHLQTYLDSNSIVPSLSPGANSAGNLVCLFKLLERFEQQPPQRPVLISVVNNHANALQGEEEFAYLAFADGQALQGQIEWFEQQLAYERFIRKTFENGPSTELVRQLRSQVATVAGKKIKPKQVVIDLLSIRRNELNDQLLASEKQNQQQEASLVETQLTQVRRVMRAFNQFGRDLVDYGQLSDTEQEILIEAYQEVSAQAQRSAKVLASSRARLLNNLSIRQRLRFLARRNEQIDPKMNYSQLFANRYRPLPAMVGLCLDLSFNTDRIGFFFSGYPMQAAGAYYLEAEARSPRLGRYVVSQARQCAAETGLENILIDTTRQNKSQSWQVHMGGKFIMPSTVMSKYAICALTLTSVQDHRPFAFTPLDVPRRIDRQRFNKVQRFLEVYLPQLIDSPKLARQPVHLSTKKPDPLAVDVSLRLQDRYTTKDVPKERVPGALLVATGVIKSVPSNHVMVGEVRPDKILMTDENGSAIFRGAVHHGGGIIAFGYDSGFRRMVQASDMGEGAKQFPSSFSSKRTVKFEEKISLMSRFDKVDLLGMTVPLTLSAASALSVLDAAQDSTPRHFAVCGLSSVTQSAVANSSPSSKGGVACVMIDPGTRFKLIMGDAVAINIRGGKGLSKEELKGQGFASDIGVIRDIVSTSSQDMLTLTETRVVELRKRGVGTPSVQKLLKSAQVSQSDVMGDPISPLERVYGFAYRAYTQGLGVVNDLIMAVVIFMSLVIPFCFFAMKLITPYTDVNRQITLFGLIFVLMVTLLYFVHPAFAIAETPIVVILAFIIMGLALMVSMILVARFNASMNQLVEQLLQSESSDAPQSRLTEAAFLVGVSNMKRRRIRTTLTCTTIVLVTFTMLSVISVGQDVDPVILQRAPTSSYNGFVYTKPGMGPISPMQLERLQARYANDATVVSRVWGMRQDKYMSYLPFEVRPVKAVKSSQGATRPKVEALHSQVMLGLSTAEDGFVAPMPLVVGRWFSSNNASEIILSVEAALLLGITPENFDDVAGDMVVLGVKLKLVGLLDDEIISGLEDLSNTPILPLRFEASYQSAMKAESSADTATGTAELDTSGIAQDLPGVDVIDPINVLFVPLDVALTVADADRRTLSVKFADGVEGDGSGAQQAWDEANVLIRFQHMRLALGLQQPVQRSGSSTMFAGGEYALTSSTTTQVGGVLKAAIPIILGATIILNTMLGSVMERKREVGIYNAIGLNPGHVMMFFLAESLVFGIVGSVAGYLIGQVLSVVITRWELVDLNLNYSSMSVVVVIFLTIATVLISTIYPAVMAARAAVPSGQRRWSLPRPQGDQIKVDFPFSYDAERVLGICAYLYDFMEENSEASTGKFLSKFVGKGMVPVRRQEPADEKGNAHEKAYAIIFDISPAPFDLGVNQKMEVYACYNPHVRAHMLAVHLTRISGERGNWVTVNQPFLETLRKRLLAWRSQPADTQRLYYEKGEQLFANAQDLSVLDESDGGDQHEVTA